MTADATTDETVSEIMRLVYEMSYRPVDMKSPAAVEAAIRALVEERDRAQHHAEEARQDHELGMILAPGEGRPTSDGSTEPVEPEDQR
jgi:hypothetical protein